MPRRCPRYASSIGLGRAAEQLQHDGQVGARPHRLLDQALRRDARSSASRSRARRLGRVARAVRDRERRERVDRLGLRGVPDRARDRRAPRAAIRSASRNAPASIRSWASSARIRARSTDGAGRDHVRRPAQRRRGARRVPRRQQVPAEPRLEDRVLEPVLPLAERRQRALGVGDGAGRPACGSGRLGGQLGDRGDAGAVRRRRRSVAGSSRRRHLHGRPGPGPGSSSPSSSAASASCGRLQRDREPARLERGPRASSRRLRVPPVMRPRRPACRRTRAPSAAWYRGRCVGQQVGHHGPGDELVADPRAARRRPGCTNPCSMASARPAARSASSPSVAAPRAAWSTEARRPPARWQPAPPRTPRRRRASCVTGRSGAAAGASSRSSAAALRRAAARAAPRSRSPSVPVSDALRSSRRAAMSSSTTSGDPADRSATRTTTEADGRSPSIPSMSAAISRRDERREVDADRRPQPRLDHREVLAQRMLAREAVRLPGEHQREPLLARVRATNVAKARVAASATWRSSSASTIGRSAATPAEPAQQRLERPRLAPLRVGERAPRGPGEPGRERRQRAAAREHRAGVPPQQRRRAPRAAAAASSGASASRTDAHGGSTGPCARPRRMSGGSGAPAARSRTSSRNRLAPMPALPATRTVVAAPACRARDGGLAPARARASRPMKRRLTTRPGIAAL